MMYLSQTQQHFSLLRSSVSLKNSSIHCTFGHVDEVMSYGKALIWFVELAWLALLNSYSHYDEIYDYYYY